MPKKVEQDRPGNVVPGVWDALWDKVNSDRDPRAVLSAADTAEVERILAAAPLARPVLAEQMRGGGPVVVGKFGLPRPHSSEVRQWRRPLARFSDPTPVANDPELVGWLVSKDDRVEPWYGG